MKKIHAVSLVFATFVWAGGCSTAPAPSSSGAGVSNLEKSRSVAEGPVDSLIAEGNSGAVIVWRGFAVVDFRARRDELGRILVAGEVKNVSQATQGVELQVVLRDEADHVLAVGSFCPAANHSIAPDDTQPFAYGFGREDRGVRVELRIVRTFYTMDTLGLAALTR